MTQEDVAKAIGCERPLVNKKLTGKKDLTVSDLEKIADMFGMTLFQLTAVLLQPIDSIKQFKA
jgi:transcriptional regulator with XRE-family HTH domain